MAFLSKVGNILRQTARKQIVSELRTTPSIFQVLRCMSSAPSSKLFVGGLSYSTDEQSLKEAFSKYGEVVEARVIMDRQTGSSRGFGFVTFSFVEEASSAIQGLDGQELHGRRVRVNYANDKPRGGGGYGGGGYGGYGGGGYGGGGWGYSSGGYGSGGGYGERDANRANAGEGFGAENTYTGGGNYNSSYGGDSNVVGGAGGSGASYDAGGNYAGENTYSNDFGHNTGNYGVAGGVGGSDNFGPTDFGGGDNYVSSSVASSSGFDGTTGMSYGENDQIDNKNSNMMGEDGSDLKEDALEGNYRDEDDFAKRA